MKQAAKERWGFIAAVIAAALLWLVWPDADDLTLPSYVGALIALGVVTLGVIAALAKRGARG